MSPRLPSPDISSFPIDSIQRLEDRTFLLGAFAEELAPYCKLPIVLNREQLFIAPKKFQFRNLVITDRQSAIDTFWNAENSRLRLFANSNLFIPVQLERIEIVFGNTFSVTETIGGHEFRWAIGNQGKWYLEIINQSLKTYQTVLQFKVDHIFRLQPNFAFSFNQQLKVAEIVGDYFIVRLDVAPGLNLFVIENKNSLDVVTHLDPRDIRFRLIDLQINIDKPSKLFTDYEARLKLHENGYEKVIDCRPGGRISLSDGFHPNPVFQNESCPFLTQSVLTWYQAST